MNSNNWLTSGLLYVARNILTTSQLIYSSDGVSLGVTDGSNNFMTSSKKALINAK